MDKSNFPSGVVVTNTDLQNVENSKAYHIQRRYVDIGTYHGRSGNRSGGRVKGLVLSVGTNTRKFKVSPGIGYTPRGDVVQLDTFSNETALADYTLDALNYICLAYREKPVSTSLRAHISDGTSQYTQTESYAELVVFSAADYASLSASTTNTDLELSENLLTSNLTGNALDRLCLLGTIPGPGGSDPINASLIVQETEFSSLLGAVVSGTPTVTGVNLTALTSGTVLGTDGKLKLVVGSGIKTLYWADPGLSSPYGTGVVVTSVGSGVQETLHRYGSSTEGLTVTVFSELLPVADGTYTDTIVVTDVYENVGGMFSAVDNLHREKIGSTLPSVDNPHGTSPEDFLEQILNFLQTMKLGKSFLSGQTVLLPRLSAIMSATTRTCIFEFGVGTQFFRVYWNPTLKRVEITVGVKLTIANSDYTLDTWTKDGASTTAVTLLTFDGSAKLACYRHLANAQSFTDDKWRLGGSTSDFFLYVENALALGENLVETATESVIPRIKIEQPDPDTFKRVLFASGAVNTAPINIYLCSSGTMDADDAPVDDYFEVVTNATYQNDNTWLAPTGISGVSTKISLGGNAGLKIQTKVFTSAATWDDTTSGLSWLDSFQVNSTAVTADVIVYANANAEVGANKLEVADCFNPRVKYWVNPDNSNPRWLVSTSQVFGIPGFGFRKYVYSSDTDFWTEKALGCYWNGTLWVRDTSGQPCASLKRYSSSGTKTLYKLNTSATWNDGDWVPASTITSQAGTPSYLNDGQLVFSNASIATNPAYGNAVPANTACALNQVKAWGRFTITGDLPADKDGFNVGSITTPDQGAQITFATPMADTNYAVRIWNKSNEGLAAAYVASNKTSHPTINAENQIINSGRGGMSARIHWWHESPLTTGFKLYGAPMQNADAAKAYLLDLRYSAEVEYAYCSVIYFEVLGRQ